MNGGAVEVTAGEQPSVTVTVEVAASGLHRELDILRGLAYLLGLLDSDAHRRLAVRWLRDHYGETP